MAGAKRAGAIAMLGCLVVAMAVWPADAWSHAPLAQDDPDTVIEVGSGPIGERTTSLVGRNRSDDATVTLYGYLAAVVGLGPQALFAGEIRTVETARFTYVAEIAIAGTENRADVTLVNGSGLLRVYLDEDAGASWEDAASFGDGQLIAEYTLDLNETRQNQAPGVGVVVGEGPLTQQAAEEFTAGDSSFRFGVTGIEQRLRYVGAQFATDDQASPPEVTLTGSTTVTRRESLIVALGIPAPAATPASSGDGCTAFDVWLAQTTATLTEVGGLGSGIDLGEDVAALDGALLQDAADRAAALAVAQRQTAVPEGAADANRLVVTAASTYARGLQVLADAAAQLDADLLELGQSALQDGADLAERAGTAADAVGAACQNNS